MRFDEYVRRNGVTVDPVDRFAGFALQVGLPTGWAAVRAGSGMRVWCERKEMSSGSFCTNAVLTMHCVATALDERDVFAMLVEEQMQTVERCQEDRRDVEPADDGIGVRGLFAMRMSTDEFGEIDSASRSRSIKYGEQTMIAQLTVTAVRASPVNRDDFSLTVRPGAGGVGVQAGDVYLE